MANKIAMVAIALLLVVSAVSVVATADTDNGQQSLQLGSYNFSDNTTNSAIINLSYQTDSGNSLIANSVKTMGASSTLNIMSGTDSNSLVLKNVTLTSAGDGNVLLFSTMGSKTVSNPTMIFNLNTSVSQVKLTSYQSTYLSSQSNGVLSNYVSHQIYRLSVNGNIFYLFSNSNSSVSGNTVTYHHNMLLLGSKLVVVLSSANGLRDKFEKELGQIGSHARFTYNNTTGQVSGRFVTMQYNATTGTIFNFTDNLTKATVFNQINATGNGSIGNGYMTPVFPTQQPIIVGNVFYFANNTAIYQLHDNPSMVSNYYISNGTMTMNVSSSMNVHIFHPLRNDVNHETFSANYSGYTNVELGDQYDVQSSSTIVFIQNSSFRGSLFIHGANVSVNNNVLSISTNKTAHITFVAPPGLQKLRRDLGAGLQYGIDHGKLAALIVLGTPGQTGSNVSVNYNGSMQISVQNVTTNKVFLKVSSKMHEGTNFAIFVPNNVIQNNSKITVMFDNQTITLTKGLNSVINATSTTQASFYFVTTSGGTLVVIHVPHFSTHTIEIVNSAVVNTNPSPTIPGGTALYAALGIIAVIAVIAGVTMRRRKK